MTLNDRTCAHIHAALRVLIGEADAAAIIPAYRVLPDELEEHIPNLVTNLSAHFERVPLLHAVYNLYGRPPVEKVSVTRQFAEALPRWTTAYLPHNVEYAVQVMNEAVRRGRPDKQVEVYLVCDRLPLFMGRDGSSAFLRVIYDTLTWVNPVNARDPIVFAITERGRKKMIDQSGLMILTRALLSESVCEALDRIRSEQRRYKIMAEEHFPTRSDQMSRDRVLS